MVGFTGNTGYTRLKFAFDPRNADPLIGREEIIQDRSCSGTFFNLNENAIIASLDQRISRLMNLPIENGEGLQILNYQVGGEYKPHFDFFPPQDASSAHHLSMGGQRVSTLVIYLNEPARTSGSSELTCR